MDTDEPNNELMPGASLHTELKWLVKAGFTPLEALQAATRAPARILVRAAVTGTISPGKDADLGLLDADPLADIDNTHCIRSVVLQGEYLDRERLDTLARNSTAAYIARIGTYGGHGG